MCEYVNMVCGFISHGQKFLCFCCRTTDLWFSLEQMPQLPGCIFPLGQHTYSVGHSMFLVGQNRCLSWTGCIYFSFWPTCMFSWPENMFFICTYTTVFLKCSLTNIYCQIYMFSWPEYMFSWPGYMFVSWPENTWGTMHVLVLASMHAELPEYRFSWLGCMFSCTFMNFSLHMFNKALGNQFSVHFANNNQKLAFNHVLIGQRTRFQLACLTHPCGRNLFGMHHIQ